MTRNYERHGMKDAPEYKIWAAMVQRCTNPKSDAWPRYGGRGIVICERWRESFSAFYADVGPRPEGLTLERDDNDGDYEPTNCRWATQKEQASNRGLRRPCSRNRTGITGVCWDQKLNTYRASITIKGVRHHLGTTIDFFEACCLRKSAEAKLLEQ